MKYLNILIINFLLIIIAVISAPIGAVAQSTFSKAVPGTLESLSQKSLAASNTPLANGLQQFYSSTGHYTLSADGVGSLSSSMSVRVNKPNAQATVQKAILISSVTNSVIANGCVTIAGVPVNWDGSAASFGRIDFTNYWADVTNIVAGQINSSPAGISTVNITECSTGVIEGEALLVVFNDAIASEKTIIVLVGALNTLGDNFPVTLAQPINPNDPGALLDMGLGIGFSYQQFGSQQFSEVSVNNQRLTSSAGGEDDGAPADGALFTVGGIGDVNTNPANPFATPANPRSDDELYNILPFITNTTTSLNINTINPSTDDNIFLAYFALSGAAIIGEGILLSQTNTSGNVGTTHTVKAAVLNTNGQPIPNRSVTFSITSGPNSGNTFSTNTDANGEASYTYTGSGGAGTDNIKACFTNSQNQVSCSNAVSFTWDATTTTCSANTISCSIRATPNYGTPEDVLNTIYVGYAAQCFKLTATVTGGVKPFTYAWSGGNKLVFDSIRRVCPGAATAYTLTVTDANGCVTTCSITINVVDVRCGANLDQVKMCYNNQEICVPKNMVIGYLRLGAKLGKCPIPLTRKQNSGGEIGDINAATISVKVYPNPSGKFINVEWKSDHSDQSTLKVIDMQGRVLVNRQYNGLLKQETNIKRLELDGLSKGSYMLQVTTKTGSKTTRFTIE